MARQERAKLIQQLAGCSMEKRPLRAIGFGCNVRFMYVVTPHGWPALGATKPWIKMLVLLEAVGVILDG